MKKYLVTGGLGFIGSNFINLLDDKISSKGVDFEIHCIDKMGFGSNIQNIKSELRQSSRFKLHTFDINSPAATQLISNNIFEFCVNFAAESHVDRSIEDPNSFVESNVLGATNLLNAWNLNQDSRFIQIGTDEVYGPLDSGFATEDYPLNPSSPYSASKAAADLIALSFKITFNMDVVVTRCTNNYGLGQHEEKLIPNLISKAQNNLDFELYGDGLNKREWIHVTDHSNAILEIAFASSLKHSIYNIGSGVEKTNVEIAELILNLVEKSMSKIKFVKDRKGHDSRYALDSLRIREEFGWQTNRSFDLAIAETVLNHH